MSRQLNLRVSDQFAESLDRVARRIGKPMATVLESLGAPALAAIEEDANFEADALAAWEEYQLTGIKCDASALEKLFSEATTRAQSVLKGFPDAA